MFAGSLREKGITSNDLEKYENRKTTQQCHDLSLDTLERSKKGGGDPTLPKDPFNHPDWQDIGHPKAKEKGHHDFINKKTGERIRFDEGKPGESGHKGKDHYHRYNLDSKHGSKDRYLDKNGNPVSENAEESHLYRN